MDGMELRGDFWWPSTDTHQHRVIFDDLADLDRAVALVPERGVAIQAGGNVGVWAANLAETFDRVVTVEPDPENLACLQRNVADRVGIVCGALGDAPTTVGLKKFRRNCGGTRIDGGGDVPMTTVDSIVRDLELDRLDLLVLDLEGYELAAFAGAIESLEAFRPVVMFEERGHGRHYQFPPAAGWLETILGYRIVDRTAHDIIMTV